MFASFRRVSLFVLVAGFALAAQVGCVDAGKVTESAQVGSSIRTASGANEQRNASPNTLTLTEPIENETVEVEGEAPRIITRGGGTWHGNSVGPNAYATLDADGTQEMSTGVTPRRIFYDRDTGRLVVSSGSDISASGVKYDGKTGKLEIASFTTSSSEPIRAGNEAFDRLAAAWTTVPAESSALVKEVLIKALEEERAKVEAITPAAGGVLTQAIELIAGL